MTEDLINLEEKSEQSFVPFLAYETVSEKSEYFLKKKKGLFFELKINLNILFFT